MILFRYYTQISNLLKLLSPPLHNKPNPGSNHNHTGQAVKPPPRSAADTVHHLPHKNQSWCSADAEEHHHQGVLEHSCKGVRCLHGGPCSGEEGGVGKAAGEKAEDDAQEVVSASRARSLEDGLQMEGKNHQPR